MQAQQLPTNSAFKFIERRKNEWRCLLCCHVRTGTIFLGLWHMMLQLLAISTVGVLLRHPELIKPIHLTRTFMVERNEIPTALAERNIPTIKVNSLATEVSSFTNYNEDDDNETPIPDSPDNGDYYASYGMFIGRPMKYEDLNLAMLVIFCALIITITMIYGAIKGKPKMLMPFFCMQLFDLFMTILSALGYMCYLPDLQRILSHSGTEYMPHGVSSLNPQYISLIVLLSLTIAVISKSYFVVVVWSCYKYLTLKRASAQPTIHYIESNFMVQNLLRPDHDFNMKKFPPPPPSYAAAVGEKGPNYPDVPPPSYNQLNSA